MHGLLDSKWIVVGGYASFILVPLVKRVEVPNIKFILNKKKYKNMINIKNLSSSKSIII